MLLSQLAGDLKCPTCNNNLFIKEDLHMFTVNKETVKEDLIFTRLKCSKCNHIYPKTIEEILCDLNKQGK